MAGELLLDTGPFVSLLDSSQRHHAACVAVLEGWTRDMVTTEAVLTEATHLLGRVPGGRRACVNFVLRGGVQVVPSSPRSLRRTVELMETYENVPMDFADATLVVLAEDLGVDVVFSLDRRRFETYRFHGKRPFRIVP